MKLKETYLRRKAHTSPAIFRREILLPAHPPCRFGTIIQPWQERDFSAMDAAWLNLAGRKEAGAVGCVKSAQTHRLPNGASAQSLDAPYSSLQRAYIERPRGHAKTSDMAVQIAWILLFSPRPVEGLAAAADRDQAALIRDAVQRIVRLNVSLCAPLQVQRHLVVNRHTGSKLTILSSDVQSSWGLLPDFVICDELCHWDKPDLWFSLLSSAAKQSHCVLAVLTNAGVGRGWQWEVRESARNSRNWYFSSLKGSQAPWIHPRWLEEQRALLPEPVFERLWENIWQHSDGEFVTLPEAEACRDANLTKQDHGQPHRHYIAAVDYAEKRDYTVGVVIHREGARFIVDRMDVVAPQPDAPVEVAWVEDWIRWVAERFHSVTFVLDEYQLIGTIQKLEPAYDIRRFEFAAGRGNHALALNLRKLILHREVAWYPGCGRVDSSRNRDDLETELSSLLLKQSPSGRCRLDHLQDRVHHNDRAFALGAACLHALENAHGADWLQITPPNLAGEFNW